MLVDQGWGIDLYKTHLQNRTSSPASISGLQTWISPRFSGLVLIGRADDKSGNSRHGTFNGFSGQTVYVRDIASGSSIYHSMDFDGTDDYIAVSDHNDFSFVSGSADQPFSLSAWINTDSATQSPIMGKAVENVSSSEYRFGLDASGKLRIILNSLGNTGTKIQSLADSALSTGTWYHVAMTYDGSETETGLNLYVDGSLVSQTRSETGSYQNMNNTSSDLEIGVDLRSSGFVQWMNGHLQDCRVYNSELTDANISTIYAAGPGDNDTLSAIGQWLLDGQGSTYDDAPIQALLDKSGNQNDWTGEGTYKLDWVGGEPAIEFNASSDYFVTDSAINLPLLHVFAVQYLPASGAHIILEQSSDANSNDGFFMYGGNPRAVINGATGTASISVAETAGSWDIREIMYDGTNVYSYRLGNQTGSTAAALGALGNDNIYMGARGGSSLFHDGHIAEVLVYNRNLSLLERNTVRDFLADPYNLTLLDDD